MSAILSKGEELTIGKPISAAVPTLTVGLEWEEREGASKKGILTGGRESAVDLDSACLMFDKEGNLVDQAWFQQLKSKCGSVVHTGDEQTGQTPGHDEVITVNLSKIPDNVESLVFTVTCFTELSFDKVTNAFITLIDITNGTISKHSLTDVGGDHTALIAGKLFRREDEWIFKVIGDFEYAHTFVKLLPTIQALL